MGRYKVYGVIIIIMTIALACEKGTRPSEYSQKSGKEIEVLVNGEPKGRLDENLLSDLNKVRWRTGLNDFQEGYCLADVFSKLGISGIRKVKVYSYGSGEEEFEWSELKNCDVLIGKTHRNTFKLIGKGKILKRKKWLRHIFRMEVETD